jgi:hypothetical protein
MSRFSSVRSYYYLNDEILISTFLLLLKCQDSHEYVSDTVYIVIFHHLHNYDVFLDDKIYSNTNVILYLVTWELV